MTTGISGIIYAKNEEALIGQAVVSLARLADEVVVADMASTDLTVEIAQRLGARVVSVPDFGYVEPARPIAETACRFDWIANIDADEILPEPLVRRLAEVAKRDDVDAIRCSRLNFMLGSPVRSAGWGPEDERHVRFYRKGRIEHSSSIHQPSRMLADSRIEELPVSDDLSIWHFNYTGWDHFLDKLNRYTTVEARDRVRSGLLSRPRFDTVKLYVKLFARRFVRQRGYRDGYRGFVLSALMVVYQLAVDAKVWQLSGPGESARIAEDYRAVAEDALTAHDDATVDAIERDVVAPPV